MPDSVLSELLLEADDTNEASPHLPIIVDFMVGNLDISGELILPQQYILSHPYPNPFNPQVMIPITLAKEAHIQLRINDIHGRLVISIANDVDFVKHVTPGEYYFNPSDMADAGNEGLFKADSVSEDGDTLLFEDSEYIIDVTTEGELKKVANNFVDATHSGSPVLYMTQVLLCPGAYVVKGVNTLDDEEDNIDLSNYLSKALVYYVKAKTAEDMMNIEAKEYFMKEFRKMVEKHNNTRVAGVRMQAAGPYAIK